MSGSYKPTQFQKLNLDPRENRKDSLGGAGDDRIVVSHIVVGCENSKL